MAETAPPWQENQPYEVRVTAKPLRSLTYDVLPPAPSSDTTAVIQEEGTNVVVKRASNGAEREFRARRRTHPPTTCSGRARAASPTHNDSIGSLARSHRRRP